MNWLKDNVDEYMECNPAKLNKNQLGYESEIVYQFCKNCNARIRGIRVNTEKWPLDSHLYLFSDINGQNDYTIEALEDSLKTAFD